MQKFAINTILIANKCILFSRKMLKIKEYRKLRGFTQHELSELSGIKKRTLINYENGDSDIPFSKLQKIANILEVSIQELYLDSTTEMVNDPLQKYGADCKSCDEKIELIKALQKTITSQEALIVMLKKQDKGQSS